MCLNRMSPDYIMGGNQFVTRPIIMIHSLSIGERDYGIQISAT